MIDTQFRTTRMTWLLLALLMAELGLVVALRLLGWFGTGSLLQMLGSILAIAIPFLFIGLVFFRDRFRLTLKGLLITVGVFAIFMAINVKPLIDYRELRAGSMALSAGTGVNLICEKYVETVDGKFKQVKLDIPEVWLPPWLIYFSRDWSKTPCDQTVIQISVISEAKFDILSKEAFRFINLEMLSVDAWHTGVELKNLPQVFKQCPKLRYLNISNAQFLPQGLLVKCENLLTMCVYSTKIDDSLVAELANCESLQVLQFLKTDLDDEQLKKIASVTKLRKLDIRVSDVTAEGVESFKKLNPACKITTDIVADGATDAVSPTD